LRGFKITIDYSNRESYWLSQTALDPHDLDQIGLTLTLKNGEYFVAAVTTQNGKPSVEGVQVGDKLLKVDALELRTSTWDAVFSAMHGSPGDIRSLHIERNGVPLTVRASIKAF
jgi:C-terminal processing protease CtpA/Prc